MFRYRSFFQRLRPGLVRRPLRENETCAIATQEGDRILVLRGGVWLTQSDDPRDHILERGAAFVADRTSNAVINALAPSVVLLCPRDRRARLSTFFAR